MSYERAIAESDAGRPYEAKPPKSPKSGIERGLIYASRAGLIAPQSVAPILERTERFGAWIAERKPARGKPPDRDETAKLFVAVEAVIAIRERRGLDEDEVVASEVGQAWELLHGRRLSEQVMKRRLARLKPQIAEFRPHDAAERRRRKKRTRKSPRGPWRGPRRQVEIMPPWLETMIEDQ
jgi:hypothetical protein